MEIQRIEGKEKEKLQKICLKIVDLFYKHKLSPEEMLVIVSILKMSLEMEGKMSEIYFSPKREDEERGDF
jgi:hypothetical protein